MIASLALAALLVAPIPAEELHTYMSRLEAIGFSGALLVTQDDRVVLEKAYGWADRARGIRAGTDTVWDLGSVTKQFTGAAILKLESEGKLRTEDLIGRYFAEVPPDKKGISLHHLLTHTSGLRSDFSESDYEPVGREEYAKRALASELLWAPGTRYHYSNAGYSLLAAVVEMVSGEPYETYLRERILKPLGIHETGYKEPGWPSTRIAHGYRQGEDWGTIIERLEPEGAPFWMLRGNGGIHTTMKDVRLWHEALETDALLPAKFRKKLVTPYVDEDESGETQYAYGWVVEKTPRGTRDIWHNGGNGIYMAELHRYVDEGILVFVASSVAELPAGQVFETVRRIAFGEPYELPPAAVAIPASSLEELEGATYRLPEGGTIALGRLDSVLTASLEGQDAYDAWEDASVDRRRLHERTARTLEIAQKEIAGDAEAEDQFGKLRSMEVLGTRSGPRGLLVTDARAQFEKGSLHYRYVWREDELLDVQSSPRLRAPRLVPVAANEWVAFDLVTGAGPRLLIHGDTLEIDGKLRAARVN